MNIFELCVELNILKQENIKTDSRGDHYFYDITDYGLDYTYSGVNSLLDFICDECDLLEDYAFMSHSKYKALSDIQIKVDCDSMEWCSSARRPYYQMRGKRVTEEQAFEIIRRTDNIFDGHDIKDYVGIENLDNWLVQRNHIPRGYGWIHRNGIVGTNAITQKYPCADDMLADAIRLASNFPYLDLIIAVTNSDEVKPSDFYGSIVIGFHIKENMIHVMNKDSTVKVYKEYSELYEESNKEVYEPEYYGDNHISQVDDDYFKKLVAANGMKLKQMLKKVPWYQWPGER